MTKETNKEVLEDYYESVRAVHKSSLPPLTEVKVLRLVGDVMYYEFRGHTYHTNLSPNPVRFTNAQRRFFGACLGLISSPIWVPVMIYWTVIDWFQERRVPSE